MVVEIPPKVLGGVNDFWYRWVADVGITGADKGRRQVSRSAARLQRRNSRGLHVVVQHVWQLAVSSELSRRWLDEARRRIGQEELKDLSACGCSHPPAIKFVNGSGIPSNFVAPGDYSFWEILNKVIQEEPTNGADPTTWACLPPSASRRASRSIPMHG